MITIAVKVTDKSVEPVATLSGKASLDQLATMIFFLKTGAYADIAYATVLEKLSPEHTTKLNDKLAGMMKLIGHNIKEISEAAELEMARRPVVSAEGEESDEY